MRETRHLWIGNLADNTREEGIAQHFKRYGKIDKVRFLPKRSADSGLCACVAFMDIRSAQKAKASVNVLGDRELVTDYFDPAARGTSTDEGQRHAQLQQRSSSSRRYDTHRESGGDDRYSRDRQSSYDRNYQQSEPGGGPDSYDSDKSRPREGTKLQSRNSNASKHHEPQSKKLKADSASKVVKKKVKKKGEDGKARASKVKKQGKERGRSPTVKQKKAHRSGTPSSQGERKRSSSEGGSSSSGSGSRSTSGSRRSSSASSSSSTGSSNSSKTHTSNSQSNSESSYEVEEEPESRKLVAMCVRKLPIRPTVTSLRDGIFHEFKKYGKVKSVLIRGEGPERHALVLFRTAADANKAVAHAKSKLLFGAAIEATIYEGEVSGQELEECGGIIDEYHPRASRTLFVGNLDKTVGYSDIQNIFVRFGEIVAIEIKKQHNIPQYAFLQYTDIVSVIRAITKMDGEKLGRNTLKLGFGKTVVSSCLWVDGVTDSFTENYLASCFQRYGPLKHVVIDRNRSQALVFFSQYDYAQTAMVKMRKRKLNGSRLKMDYASNELIEIFLKHMQSSGQSVQGLENIRQLLQPPSSPTSGPPSGGLYSRSSLTQDSRGSYFDDRPQTSYSEEQHLPSEGSYRRGWRGRSRERFPHPSEPSSHGRQKRGFDEPYERSDYHREQSWDHDGYDNRRTSHYDQDYRQRDHDIRRDQRGYNRKPSRGSAQYDEPHHYRGSRDRVREDREIERVPDRDRYFSRSSHLSPSHPRYISRRSRSISPPVVPRETERYSVERSSGDAGYRRHGRSRSRTPDASTQTLRRRNSMESKSSSHSGSRYTSRTGDVDMREYLDEDKVSVSNLDGDERIVEYSEKAKKLRVRKRITSDSPARESDTSPKRHSRYRSGAGKDQTPQDKEATPTREETPLGSDSPTYSDNRSRSGTPTRDENQDLIGEVIIKQPLKSRGAEKVRPKDDIKPSVEEDRKDRGTPSRDKDYRKRFSNTSDSSKLSKSKPARSNSSSLIQRVHSPLETERKSSLPYTKDFDYRKHATVRSSKSSGDVSTRHRSSKVSISRQEEAEKTKRAKDYDDVALNSPRSISPAEKQRHRASGSSRLLKREYSPRPEDDGKTYPAKLHKSSDRSRPDAERQVKEKSRGSGRSRDEEHLGDVDERRSYSQKRRHSVDLGDDDDTSAVSNKRERKSSSGDYSRHKSSHHIQSSQKHEAPMSIARQMFLQEEEGESGAESPALSKPAADQAVEDIKEVLAISKSDAEVDDKKATSSADQSPTTDFANATVVAAQSLLPKRLPKPAPKPSEEQPKESEKKTKGKKDDGNLTELEKEKERLQKLLSKLDSEKQLDVKEAEEVADVVLQELTEKTRSKLLASKPANQPVEKPQPTETEKPVEHALEIDATSLEIAKAEEIEHEDVTFEEEIVVDTIEEVTEDEVVETEVEEVALKEEQLQNPPDVVEETPTEHLVEIPVPVLVPVVSAHKIEEYDHTQGYRKQMEAKKREMEKSEKRKEHEVKKLLKKQEKEKKKQIKRVQAMRGPNQSVISSVDDDVNDDVVDDAEVTTPSDVKTSPLNAESKRTDQEIEGDSMSSKGTPAEDAKNDEASTRTEEGDAAQTVFEVTENEKAKNDEASICTEEVNAAKTSVLEVTEITQAKNDQANTEKKLQNPGLERPWPPDKEKPEDIDKAETPEVKNTPDIKESDANTKNSNESTTDVKSADTTGTKSSSVTPGSADTPIGSTPHAPGKEPSPKSAGMGITPSGSLTSSVSHRSSLTTPTTTPSQMTRTPNFTTPSPASTSSNSSSKSQQKQVKTMPPHHRSGQQQHPSKQRPGHHGRPDHHSRSRSTHNSDHKRRPSNQQLHRSSSSSSHGSKPWSDGTKKPIPAISRRTMATITVGLDASPSKPLGKSELERLRMELESVKSQLNLEMSPSSLSPCSGDEGGGGKSPAQLLSPVSPVLRSPADSLPTKRVETASPALQTGVSPGSTPTLTDRLKLLGRVKKKTPGTTPRVKTEDGTVPPAQQDKELEFRQSRIFRSSIFDQDSERLSRVCRRQLEDDRNAEDDKNITPIPSVVPLFSGSKFLEPSTFPSANFPSASISTAPLVPSVAAFAPPTSLLVSNADGAVMPEQPQFSSITGPKNVPSLSSSELPATAERKPHDFAGKNCNIESSNTLTNDAKEHVRSEESEECSKPIVLPPVSASESLEPVSQVEGLEAPASCVVDVPENQDQSFLQYHTESPSLSPSNAAGAQKIADEIGSDPPRETEGHQEPEDHSNLEFKEDLDSQTLEVLENATISEKLDTQTEVTKLEAAEYLGEVVCDMEVYAGSCMEISGSPTGLEVTDTIDHEVGLAEEVNTLDTVAECTNESLDIGQEATADADDSKLEKNTMEVEISTAPLETDEKESNVNVLATSDAKIEEIPIIEEKTLPPATESGSKQETENTPPSEDVKSISDITKTAESKPKSSKKSSEKPETTKDAKKSKHITKHKLHQKDSKLGSKESGSKKGGLKKQKSDESKKQIDSKPTTSRDAKVKSDNQGSTKPKSISDKSVSKALDKEPAEKSSSPAEVKALTEKPQSEKKDSKASHPPEPNIMAIEKVDSSAPVKTKEKESSSKEKKLHKEGKKDKKALTDSKTDTKKSKKKAEKHGIAQSSEALALQKTEAKKEKEHVKEGALPESNKDSKKAPEAKVSASQETKTLSHSVKGESKETAEKLLTSKKKKKKKQSSERDEGKSSEKKLVKQSENVTKPPSDASKSSQEIKKTSEKSEKIKKSSKSTMEKSKVPEPKPSDKESNIPSSKHKRDGTKDATDKTGSKDLLKKVTKAHSDLKASHSFPGKTSKKEDEIPPTKKDKKSKSEKSSSMSPAHRKHSRYSLIYSSEDSDDSDTPITSKKSSAEGNNNNKQAKKVEEEKVDKSLSKSEEGDSSSKWPGREAGGKALGGSFERHWSSSSSSSMSDSAGPPPVVASSLLVTETIKNETILPPGYNTVRGFTDSSDEDQDEEKKKREDKLSAGKVEEAKTSSKKSEGKRKNPSNHELTKSTKKEKRKTPEGSKSSTRRIMWSSSDSDSSDGELVIYQSDISEFDDEDIPTTTISKPSKPDTKLDEGKKSQVKSLGLDLSSSDSDGVTPKPTKADEPKAKDVKVDKKKSTASKTPAKSVAKKKSKTLKSTSRINFDSDSSVDEELVREKKKKLKGEKESHIEKKKVVQEKSVMHRKSDERPKLGDSVVKKSAIDWESSDSESSSESDISDQEKLESKDVPISKSKGISGTLKKSASSKMRSKSKDPVFQGSKTSLEKTKSDSKAMKSSTKSLEKKEKFKSKSHSTESRKLKENPSKVADTKVVAQPQTQDRQRSTSKDKQKVDKESLSEELKVAKDAKPELPVPVKKDLHSHKGKHQKHATFTPTRTAISEPKAQAKNPVDQSSQKHSKKSSKEGKKSDKKPPSTSEPAKDSKSDKDKGKSDISADMGKHEKHGKKKKVKKAHKKETKSAEKVEERKQQELIISEEPETLKPQSPEPKGINPKSLTHSLFDSDSDDNDFEIPPTESEPSLVKPTGKTGSGTHKTFKKTNSGVAKEKGYRGGLHGSPHKQKPSLTSKTAHLHSSRPLATQKVSEKRRGSAESFLTTSTTDESDVEQRSAKQSAISPQEHGKKVEKALKADEEREVLTKREEYETGSEKRPALKSTDVKKEMPETDASTFSSSVNSQALSPSKKSILSESREGKRTSHKAKEGMVKQEPRSHSSSPKASHSGYSRSKHGLHYGVKDRRENMDKIKSVSHERDEEAVRSIMGLLDESSDADSYFSDVRPDEGATSSAMDGKTSDTDRSQRQSKDSDKSSGFGQHGHVEPITDDVIKTESAVTSVDITNVKTEAKLEPTEERTTAEENELAAAVSSIEGLFGDFDNKQAAYDDFSSPPSSKFSDHRVTSDDRSQTSQKTPLRQEQEVLSQEEVEKGSEEAALAASTLLAESSEEDGSFYGFQPTPNRNIAFSEQVTPMRDKTLSQGSRTPHSQTSIDIELPSIRDDPVPQNNDAPPPTTAKISDTPTITQSSSRKRHRQSKGRGSPARSSSRESKSDWSASAASTSESEAIIHEPDKAPGPNPAKQRKIGRSPATSTRQPPRSNQFEFEVDVKANVSLRKPDNPAGNLPFVCTSSVAQAQVQHSTPSVTTAAATPFVNVSSSPTPPVIAPSISSEFSTTALKPPAATPPQQPRKTSRDSDVGSAPGSVAKRRLSSSSSSSAAAISPTRGSQMSQLTPAGLNNPSQPLGGMQMLGSLQYPSSNNPPFLPAQSSAVPVLVHQNVPTVHAGIQISSSPFHVPLTTTPTFTTPSVTPSSHPDPYHSQIHTQLHPQGYHPHMPQQVQNVYAARPVHPPSAPHSSIYAQQPALGPTNTSSMPGHTNVQMHLPTAGALSLATTLQSTTLSFPPVASASLTSPTQRQSQFVHQHSAGAAALKPTEATQPMQYHVGVPTYPHRTLSHPQVPPTTQQSTQRAPTPQESSATHQETAHKSLPRPTFSHLQALSPSGHPIYQPHMYPNQSQISPQALGQPPFSLPSSTRPPAAQLSPTISAAPIMPMSQEKHATGLPRPPSNPYMPQQNVPQLVQSAPPPQRAAPPQPKPAEVQHSMSHQQLAVKSEPQRSQPSTPAANTPQPGLPQVSPQAMYRKLDPTLPHHPGAQPGLTPQQVFAHTPLYYPGMHSFPGLPPGLPYMAQPFLRHGVPPPVSVVHQMARQTQQAQQRMQIPQQRMMTEKPTTQPHATLPQTPIRKDQAAPTASSKASPTVRDAPHPIHATYGSSQVVTQPHGQSVPQMPPYQPYAVESASAAHVLPHRTEHGDRVVRAPSDQAQADMVEQHFRRCGIAATPPRSHPSPSTGSATASTDKPRYAAPQKLEPPFAMTQHPGLNPQGTRHPLSLLPGYAIPPGMRYPVAPLDPHMWPRPGANFRPPPVPVVASQQSSYLPTVSSTNHPTSGEPHIRMPVSQPVPHQTPPSPATSQTSSEMNNQVMGLFQRYPVIWQGLLALRNDSAAVQTHFICGDRALAEACLPEPDAQSETDKERNLAILRIVQRMRLEPSQLEGIDKRMMDNSDFCLLLALPCGRDESDVIRQQNALKQSFIDYLKQKQAAGIVNVQHRQTQIQAQYVLHVFPPCEFTTKHLQLHAQDLLSNINDIQHIMIVIAAV